MTTSERLTAVRRRDRVTVIDLVGDVNARAEESLASAWEEATRDGPEAVILNFDDDYKSAMTAVLKKSDFSKFPDVSDLVGKEVVISGKFMDFKGSPEIELSDPKQVALVK